MVVRALFWLLQYVSWHFEPSDALQTGNLRCWKLISKNRPSINHIRYMCTNQHNNYEVETEIYSETATAIFKEQGLILVSPEGRDCGWCQTGFPEFSGATAQYAATLREAACFCQSASFSPLSPTPICCLSSATLEQSDLD